MAEALTLPEAAARLRVSVKALRRLEKAGRLAMVPVSLGEKRKKRVVEAGELERFLSERSRPIERRRSKLPPVLRLV